MNGVVVVWRISNGDIEMVQWWTGGRYWLYMNGVVVVWRISNGDIEVA
jgi:hypothetical protein